MDYPSSGSHPDFSNGRVDIKISRNIDILRFGTPIAQGDQ
jgi:hypothetical protein